MVKYKKIGRLVFVVFSISGTSDGTNAQFELPYASAEAGLRFACNGKDNGSSLTGGAAGVVYFNSNTRVECQPDQGTDLNIAGWTNSETTKAVSGQFFYEATS